MATMFKTFFTVFMLGKAGLRNIEGIEEIVSIA
jgi:hypothetical protein